MLTDGVITPDRATSPIFPFVEEVRGVIIGGEYFSGKVYYDGRCQRDQAFYADTEDELIAQAREFVAEMKAKFKDFPCFLYPDDDKWELRIRE